jgi:hypothetical protein
LILQPDASILNVEHEATKIAKKNNKARKENLFFVSWQDPASCLRVRFRVFVIRFRVT